MANNQDADILNGLLGTIEKGEYYSALEALHCVRGLANLGFINSSKAFLKALERAQLNLRLMNVVSNETSGIYIVYWHTGVHAGQYSVGYTENWSEERELLDVRGELWGTICFVNGSEDLLSAFIENLEANFKIKDGLFGTNKTELQLFLLRAETEMPKNSIYVSELFGTRKTFAPQGYYQQNNSTHGSNKEKGGGSNTSYQEPRRVNLRDINW